MTGELRRRLRELAGRWEDEAGECEAAERVVEASIIADLKAGRPAHDTVQLPYWEGCYVTARRCARSLLDELDRAAP